VHTVEHVLAAFAGYGVDNAIVELDANEPPIGDGSSREFCKMIQSAGIVPLSESREVYTVTEPIQIEMGETTMTLVPDDGFKVTCTSADKGGRFTQFFSTDVTTKTWEKELSHARTFCFYEEIEYLIKNGLIKGGSLENAVVIRDDAVLTTEPLRYTMNSSATRCSTSSATRARRETDPRPSHRREAQPRGNVEMARQIRAQMEKPKRAAQTFAPPPPAPKPATTPAVPAEIPPDPAWARLGIDQIMKCCRTAIRFCSWIAC
jgi:hypothetical protein